MFDWYVLDPRTGCPLDRQSLFSIKYDYEKEILCEKGTWKKVVLECRTDVTDPTQTPIKRNTYTDWTPFTGDIDLDLFDCDNKKDPELVCISNDGWETVIKWVAIFSYDWANWTSTLNLLDGTLATWYSVVPCHTWNVIKWEPFCSDWVTVYPFYEVETDGTASAHVAFWFNPLTDSVVTVNPAATPWPCPLPTPTRTVDIATDCAWTIETVTVSETLPKEVLIHPTQIIKVAIDESCDTSRVVNVQEDCAWTTSPTNVDNRIAKEVIIWWSTKVLPIRIVEDCALPVSANVPNCDWTTTATDVDSITATYLLNQQNKHTEVVYDALTAVFSGTVSFTYTAPTQIAISYAGVSLANDTVIGYWTDFWDWYNDLWWSPLHSYNNDWYYEIKWYAVTLSWNKMLVYAKEVDIIGWSITYWGVNPQPVNRSFRRLLNSALQDYCNNTIVWWTYNADWTAYTPTWTLQLHQPIVIDELEDNAEYQASAAIVCKKEIFATHDRFYYAGVDCIVIQEIKEKDTCTGEETYRYVIEDWSGNLVPVTDIYPAFTENDVLTKCPEQIIPVIEIPWWVVVASWDTFNSFPTDTVSFTVTAQTGSFDISFDWGSTFLTARKWSRTRWQGTIETIDVSQVVVVSNWDVDIIRETI